LPANVKHGVHKYYLCPVWKLHSPFRSKNGIATQPVGTG
jgi:hypothetical protein